MSNKNTITEVAKEAGLSIGAVSKVLNGLPVRASTKEKVEKAIKKTGYTPNAFARGIRKNNKGNIGIITTPFRHNDWVQDLVFKIVSHSLDYNVNFLLESMEDSATPPRLLSLVDGFILIGSFDNEFYKTIKKAGNLPIVTLGPLPEYENISTVSIDNVDAGRMLTNHLILMGHKKIAFTGPMTISGKERFSGYKDVMTEYFGGYEESYVMLEETSRKREIDSGYDLTAKLLALPEPPTAIIYTTEYVAMGGFQIAGENNIKIPDDISMVSFSGVANVVETRPALTGLVYDNEKLANKMLELFFKQMKSRKQGEEHFVKTFYMNKQQSVKNMNMQG